MQNPQHEYQRPDSFDHGYEEEHLARYGHSEENTLDAFIATDEQLLVKL